MRTRTIRTGRRRTSLLFRAGRLWDEFGAFGKWGERFAGGEEGLQGELRRGRGEFAFEHRLGDGTDRGGGGGT